MEHIRGATFKKICTYKDRAGIVQNLTNVGIRAQIRTVDGTLIADVLVTKLPQVFPSIGQYFMVVQDTRAWPIGNAQADIEYTQSSDISITERIYMNIAEQVTQ